MAMNSQSSCNHWEKYGISYAGVTTPLGVMTHVQVTYYCPECQKTWKEPADNQPFDIPFDKELPLFRADFSEQETTWEDIDDDDQ